MNKKIIFLGLISFIIALLWQAPATLLTNYLEQNNPRLSIKGISGTFWQGSAEQVMYQQNPLGKADWTISPLGLLSAGFAGHIALASSDFNLDGDFVSGMDGSLLLSDAQFDISAQWINRVQSYAVLAGSFRGLINEFESQPSNPIAPPLLNGTLNWEQGAIKSPLQLPSGNYQLAITPDDAGKLTGQLSTNKAPLAIKGTVSLDKTWQYATDLKVKTTPKGKALAGFLAIAGKKSPDGSVNIKKTGTLAYLIPTPES